MFLSLILFTNCSFENTDSAEEDEEVDYIFSKKQECHSYLEELENRYSEDDSYFISEIFYSPFLNTCIAHLVMTNYYDGEYSQIDSLVDVLTSSTLDYFVITPDNEEDIEGQSRAFYSKIELYKGNP